MTNSKQGAAAETVASAPMQAAKAQKDFFTALGYLNSNYYFFVKGLNLPVKLKAGQFKAKELIRIAPLEYWQTQYPTSDKRKKFFVEWSEVAIDLMGQCHKAGIFQGAVAPKDIPFMQWVGA